jgi:hypothetical protein
MALLNSNFWRSIIIIPSIVGILYGLSTNLYELWMGIVVSSFCAGLLGLILYRQKQLRNKAGVSNTDQMEVTGMIDKITSVETPLQELFSDSQKPRLIYWELEEYQHTGRTNLWVKRAAGITGATLQIKRDKSNYSESEYIDVLVPSIGIASEYSVFNKLPVGKFGQSQSRETNFGSLYVKIPDTFAFRTIEIKSQETPPEPIVQLLDKTEDISPESVDPLSSNILQAPNVRGDRRFKFVSIPIKSDIYVTGKPNPKEFQTETISVQTTDQSILTPQSKKQFVQTLQDKIHAILIICTGFILSTIILTILFFI